MAEILTPPMPHLPPLGVPPRTSSTVSPSSSMSSSISSASLFGLGHFDGDHPAEHIRFIESADSFCGFRSGGVAKVTKAKPRPGLKVSGTVLKNYLQIFIWSIFADPVQAEFASLCILLPSSSTASPAFPTSSSFSLRLGNVDLNSEYTVR